MSQRINPITPNGLRPMPVPRVERRKRTPEEHQPGDEQEPFDEELERGLRETGSRRPIDPQPNSPTKSLSPQRLPPPEDGHPHIDVSV